MEMSYSILENKWIFNTLDFRQIYDNSTLFLCIHWEKSHRWKHCGFCSQADVIWNLRFAIY